MLSAPVILLLEDEALIAMSLEDEFEAAGYKIAGAFATCKRALAWLEGETPAVAVLDTTLGDETCKDVALELNQRGIPFVVYSGNLEHQNTVEELSRAIWIEKPSPAADLLAAVEAIRGSAKKRQRA